MMPRFKSCRKVKCSAPLAIVRYRVVATKSSRWPGPRQTDMYRRFWHPKRASALVGKESYALQIRALWALQLTKASWTVQANRLVPPKKTSHKIKIRVGFCAHFLIT